MERRYIFYIESAHVSVRDGSIKALIRYPRSAGDEEAFLIDRGGPITGRQTLIINSLYMKDKGPR